MYPPLNSVTEEEKYELCLKNCNFIIFSQLQVTDSDGW